MRNPPRQMWRQTSFNKHYGATSWRDAQDGTAGPCSLGACSVWGTSFIAQEAVFSGEEITIVPVNCVRTEGTCLQGQEGLTQTGFLRRMEPDQ